MKRICLFLAILALPALLFAAPASESASGGGYIRHAWWGNTVRDERTIRVAQLFMEKNPGVTVETEPTNWDGYWLRMNTLAAAGNLPDVMQQDYAYIEQYNDRNQLADLNPFVQRGIIDISKHDRGSLASGTLNNKLIGLVLGTNAWGMGVDRGVLQQAGVTINDTAWTWKDYEQYALQIYQRTGVQTMPITGFVQIPEHISRQFGLSHYAANGRSLGYSGNAQATAAIKEVLLDMQLRLRAAGALYDPEDSFIQGRAMEEMPISTGKTWNNYHWSNQHVAHQTAAKRPLDYLLCPSVSGNRSPFGTYLKAGQFISLLTSSKSQDLGAKYIEFFVNNIDANRILLAERGIPVPSNVREDLAARVDADMKYLFDYITRVTPFTSPIDPPYPARTGEVEDAARTIHIQVLTGRINSDAGMSQIVQNSNAILSR